MSLALEQRKPVHFPAKEEKFEFDAEVSAIFDNMARRSIPMYLESHRIHAEIAYKKILNCVKVTGRRARIMDFGCSTGAFLDALCRRFQNSHTGVKLWDVAEVDVLDMSEHMLARLVDRHPHAYAMKEDAIEVELTPNHYDILNTSYLMQFIPPEHKASVMLKLAECTVSGGLLISSQKEEGWGEYAEQYNKLYIDMRLANGYTQEEIDAKTKALAGSMWCMKEEDYQTLLGMAGFSKIQPTTRWLQFSSYIAERV